MRGRTYAKWCLDSCRVLKSNRMRQILMIRTIPLEIGLSAHDHACPNIGPFQKLQKCILSNARSVSQTVATLPSTVESHSLFGGQPVVS